LRWVDLWPVGRDHKIGGKYMSYYFSKTFADSFEDALARVTAGLKEQGFGILTDIDVQKTLKAKLGVEFRKYRILGACNPPLAFQALGLEDKIGTLLPCSVVVQEAGEGTVEVAAVDPRASIGAVGNPRLNPTAERVAGLLKKVIDGL
jgi:uncharacterized protein (DUF302 family)